MKWESIKYLQHYCYQRELHYCLTIRVAPYYGGLLTNIKTRKIVCFMISQTYET